MSFPGWVCLRVGVFRAFEVVCGLFGFGFVVSGVWCLVISVDVVSRCCMMWVGCGFVGWGRFDVYDGWSV